MAAIDSAYQYYLSTYGNSTVSRYDTHKKSQLRDTYNKIVKTNKESPLYKIKNLGEAKKYAIDIKESVGAGSYRLCCRHAVCCQYDVPAFYDTDTDF